MPQRRNNKGQYVSEKKIKIFCKKCSKKVTCLSSTDRKFCSKKCADFWRRGKTNVSKGVPRPQFSRENHPRWKGKTTDDDGYILIYPPKNYPYKTRQGDRMLEHRFVIQNHLKRSLEPSEIPHHINGDKADNRLENLYLFPSIRKHVRYSLLCERYGKIKAIHKSNLK